MQSEKPKRGQRFIDQTKQLGIPIHTFKDFINCRLDYTLPEDYATMSNDQKKEAWRQNIKRLKDEPNKLSYQLPDNRTQEEVDLIIEVAKEQSQDDSLDWEYEEMFLGNKKQLVVFKKCKELNDYLEKYKLPKNFEGSLKDVETEAKSIFELKIQRNIAISLGNQEKLTQLNTQLKGLEVKFDKVFSKFSNVMQKILVHFKGQPKRQAINIEPLREMIYQKLKYLAEEHDLKICPRYQDVDNDEFISVQILKKTQLDQYFDQQFVNGTANDKPEEEEHYTDESSVVSNISEAEEEIKMEQKKKKILPPVGVYAILYQNYENKTLTLKISFETPRNKLENPNFLEYSTDKNDFKQSIEIKDATKDTEINIPIEKGGYISYFFRTRNEAGHSPIKNFKYFLKVDFENNSIKNGNTLFIGQDKILIPSQRTRKEGDFSFLTLAACDFSMSSTQVAICDFDGSAADWGLFKHDNKEGEKIIQENNLFKVVNNQDSMYYQEPGIRFEKECKIIKISCGPGFTMVLDAYGFIWAFGKNHCGQLGIKKEIMIEDPVKIKFFEENKIFITDIKTSQCLASFAIDSNGTLYKWGVNQFHSTNRPIYDRFGKLINYSLENYLEEQWVPIAVKKHFANERIIQIEAGNEYFLMLNNEGTLYGWGQCRNLGKGVFKDGNDEEIENICNEIELLQNVTKVSACRNHAIVATKDGKVFGWGNLEYLSKEKKDFSETVVDLTDEYGIIEEEDQIVCGPNYTCLYKGKEGKIKLIGDTGKFQKTEFELKQKVRKMECEHEVIGILVQK